MLNEAQLHRHKEMARIVRRDILDMIYRAKAPHIGSSFSAVEILVALYFECMHLSPDNPRDAMRDRFILSKGHACAALYSVLARRGFYDLQVLDGFGVDGGVFEWHPSLDIDKGIELSTGSLGHGLPIAVGMGIAARLDESPYRVFCLLGDGEMNEGSIWEAAMLASHCCLDNIVAIVDYNKMQGLGRTAEVVNLEPLSAKWRSFGWGTEEIDGHDLGQIIDALMRVPFGAGKPSAIIAHTVKGKGVSMMEDDLLWHYRCPDHMEYLQALGELG